MSEKLTQTFKIQCNAYEVSSFYKAGLYLTADRAPNNKSIYQSTQHITSAGHLDMTGLPVLATMLGTDLH